MCYKDVYSSPKSFGFDEWPGLATKYVACEKKLYNEVNDFADLSYKTWYFYPSEEGYRRLSTDKKYHTHNVVYLFDSGKLFKVGVNGEGNVAYTECMYVHFQKRKVTFSCEACDKFLILPPGKIISEFDEITLKYLKKVAKEKKFYFAYFKMRLKNLIKKIKG